MADCWEQAQAVRYVLLDRGVRLIIEAVAIKRRIPVQGRLHLRLMVGRSVQKQIGIAPGLPSGISIYQNKACCLYGGYPM